MNKKIKNNENEAQIIRKEDLDRHNSRGIYMRDDHCDWGFKWNERSYRNFKR